MSVTLTPNLQGHTGFSLAADAFFKLFPRESRVDGSDPRMVVLFELIDKAASKALTEAAVVAAWAAEADRAETPFSECVNSECPIGCPESHATPPSYWAMVDADAEPDEPVVQEVNRG